MTLLTVGQLFQYAEQQALNAVFLRAQSPATGPTYMAFSTSAVAGQLNSVEVAMSGTSINEPSTASGYARQPYGPVLATAASPSALYNNASMTWGPFTSAPGTMNWAIACDALSGGAAHPIASYLLSTPLSPNPGDSLVVAAGSGVPGAGLLCQL